MQKSFFIFLIIAAILLIIVVYCIYVLYISPRSSSVRSILSNTWKTVFNKIVGVETEWKLYQNKEYGFQLKFPADLYSYVEINKPKYRDGKYDGITGVITTLNVLPENKIKNMPKVKISVYEKGPDGNYYGFNEDCVYNKDYPDSKYYVDKSFKDQENFIIDGKDGNIIFCYWGQEEKQHTIQFISPEIINKYKLILIILPVNNEENDRYENLLKEMVSSVKFTNNKY